MHEWLVPRNALPIKRIQNKIFHPINCILLTRSQHDQHNRYLRDYKCFLYKLKQHKLNEIEEWLSSLGLRTFGTLKQWIARHEAALEIEESKQIKYD